MSLPGDWKHEQKHSSKDCDCAVLDSREEHVKTRDDKSSNVFGCTENPGNSNEDKDEERILFSAAHWSHGFNFMLKSFSGII